MSAAPAGTARSSFVTLEDAKIGFNILCCVCGIGSLGMPSNYARAGPVFATIALLFMAFANIYATIALSRVMLVAPSSAKTFGDIGRWAMGKTGYYLVMISQLGVCLLTPCAFLVLGGQLLDVLFPDSFNQTVWIAFMALLVIPAALIPNLKSSAGAAAIGCVATIIADVIAVTVLLYELRGHPSIPTPDVTLHQVLTSFGNLSLAYGVAIIIPDLQRQHSQPHRMPRVVLLSLGLGSAFFLALAVIGYSAGGCQISGNILFSIANTADPSAVTTLGFTAHRGAVIMSYLFMQVHISIVFSTLMQPTFYMLERVMLGMHKDDDADLRDSYQIATTPSGSSHLGDDLEGDSAEVVDLSAAKDEAMLSEYRGTKNVIRYTTTRIVVIVALGAVSIALRDHFLDIVDFTGATFITVSCLILPLVFYLKVLWTKLALYDKALSLVIIVICLVTGVYVMIYAGKNLFNPDSSSATFPYCSEEYQTTPYYVRGD